jgi:hypothetical protein
MRTPLSTRRPRAARARPHPMREVPATAAGARTGRRALVDAAATTARRTADGARDVERRVPPRGGDHVAGSSADGGPRRGEIVAAELVAARPDARPEERAVRASGRSSTPERVTRHVEHARREPPPAGVATANRPSPLTSTTGAQSPDPHPDRRVGEVGHEPRPRRTVARRPGRRPRPPRCRAPRRASSTAGRPAAPSRIEHAERHPVDGGSRRRRASRSHDETVPERVGATSRLLEERRDVEVVIVVVGERVVVGLGEQLGDARGVGRRGDREVPARAVRRRGGRTRRR